MITFSVIHRVFALKFQGNQGTGFTIDVDGKQYLITAKHIVKNIAGDDVSIEIYHANKWKLVKVRLVGHCDQDVDISVLATNIQLSPAYIMEPTPDGLAYGQDVYFLGFPYTKSASPMNRNFPFPFVKKAIVSWITDDAPIVYLDGHNNKGFSGGPVVFRQHGSNAYQVAGVISGYFGEKEPVVDENNIQRLIYESNTGIIIAYLLGDAVRVIESNPIGFQINSN